MQNTGKKRSVKLKARTGHGGIKYAEGLGTDIQA
jgi:hypothetical protein